MELGPEDVSLLERCPHFRGCYVQASMELGPEDVSLLERCPHFRGCYVKGQEGHPGKSPRCLQAYQDIDGSRVAISCVEM